MDNQKTVPLDAVLASLAETRGTLDAIEERWKLYRAESRRLTLLLITEYEYSILKASNLSGHHRTTIMSWLAASGFKHGQ